MVYMDGVRLNDVDKLKELGVDMQALVESITRSYAHQIYVDGFFNADPHPGERYFIEIGYLQRLPIAAIRGVTARWYETLGCDTRINNFKYFILVLRTSTRI